MDGNDAGQTTNRRRVPGAVAVSAPLVVGLLLAGSSTPAAAAASFPRAAYVCEQLGSCSVKPRQLAFSANNDLIGAKLRWTHWGKPTTTATGVIRVNWGGTPKLYQGKVKLSGLSRCAGTKAYRKGTVTWPGESVKVTFDCP